MSKKNKKADKKSTKVPAKSKKIVKNTPKKSTAKSSKTVAKKVVKAKPVSKKVSPKPSAAKKTGNKSKKVSAPNQKPLVNKKVAPKKNEVKAVKSASKTEKSIQTAPSKKKALKESGKKIKPGADELEVDDIDLGDDIESLELDAEVPEAEDDFLEEEVVKAKPKGRKRRKKGDDDDDDDHVFDSDSLIRKQPLKIDITKPLIKRGIQEQPKPFVNTTDKRTRYSDKELTEFKELILKKLNEAETDYDLLKSTLSNKDNHGTDDTSPTFKLLEDGSSVLSKEETAQLAARQEKYIISLRNALIRIENKSYGVCRQTGKLIPKERLRSVPHATLSIDAKLSQNS